MEYQKIKLPQMNPKQVADEIGDFVINKIVRMGKNGGVIGLSGGVDSTTSTALTQKAFIKYNAMKPKARFNKYKATNPETNLELVVYMLPSKLNPKADENDATKVAKKLGIRYEIHNISPIVEAYYCANPEIFNIVNDFHKGNLMARIRANILSTKSAVENKLVIGTGNKDEDFGIGYFTLFGDGAVHLSPLGNLSKRLVRQMATYLGFKDPAQREPTAGLEPGQTDFKDLGYNYDAVELVITGLEQGFGLEELVKDKDVIATLEPQLKLTDKFRTVREAVKNIWNRHYNIALPKMQIIHPQTAPVTLEYK